MKTFIELLEIVKAGGKFKATASDALGKIVLTHTNFYHPEGGVIPVFSIREITSSYYYEEIKPRSIFVNEYDNGLSSSHHSTAQEANIAFATSKVGRSAIEFREVLDD